MRLRIFLTSRPDVPIRHGIRAIPQAERQDFVLNDIQPAIINHDISLFLEHHLGIVAQEWTLGPKWPGEEVLEQLVFYASGLFIWAATTCRFKWDDEELRILNELRESGLSWVAISERIRGRTAAACIDKSNNFHAGPEVRRSF